MKIFEDVKNSTPLIRIYDEKYDYSFGYYTNNEWVDATRLILARNPALPGEKNREFKGKSELVLIDLIAQTEKVICTAEEFGSYTSDYVVHKNKLYYISNDYGLFCKDIESGEKKLLHPQKGMYLPHMTADGKYLNVTLYPENKAEGMFACLLFDLEKGSVEKVFETRFENPMPDANHMMICPTDPDKIFFAHEGNTHYISNRLWIWERDKGMRCLAKQKLDQNGNLADCFGHECWAPDGKGLYFLKYPCSPVLPTGICYVSTQNEQTDVLYSKYLYWHVCASPDGCFLASDTTGRDHNDPEFSGICLIDLKTGEEKMLVKADITWRHPCHPHPKFTLDSSDLMFHELYNDRICVNLIKLSDVIK